MEPLHLAIALIPLALYLIVLGIINLSRRPFIVTGSRDNLALALGLSGMVVVGPMELFMPERAAQTFGSLVWVLMIILYFLVCVLFSLMARPRLVIYNIAPTELKPLLEQAVKSVDAEASWADETYVLPQAYVQLHVETFPALRNASLVSIGTRQSWQSWRRLELTLAELLGQQRGALNPYGLTLILFGCILGAMTVYKLQGNQQAVVQALWEMLRL